MTNNIDVEPAIVLDDLGVDYHYAAGQLQISTCPTCNTSKGKVFMDEETGLGLCFSGSCQAHYNLNSFVKAYTNKSWPEVFRYLESFGKPTRWSEREAKARVDKTAKLLLPLCDMVVDLPAYKSGNESSNFLYTRGITKEIAAKYNLMWCESGHFEYKLNGTTNKQDYSGRLIAPIYNTDGVLTSFQGRGFAGQAKKYLFPPGYAATGQMLYGCEHHVDQATAVLCEGVFDVWAVDRAVDTTKLLPLGSFGKSFSTGLENDQMATLLKLKLQGLREVIIMWDGDSDSVSKAVDTGLQMLYHGFKVKIAFCLPDKDPDDMTADEVNLALQSARRLTKIRGLAIKSAAKGIYG